MTAHASRGIVIPAPLPVPAHYDPEKVGQVWRVPYQQRAEQAREWAQRYQLGLAAEDRLKIALTIIDAQNTFCIPDFELFVGGRSGMGAVDDNRRLCEFIYQNIGAVSHITVTMDTHLSMQIFHPIFLVDEHGEHPAPHTVISHQDILQGRWRFNPAIARSLGISVEYGQEHLLHYTRALKERKKYDLTIWPYHAMLGGIGHALVSAVEEAIFFHTVARNTQAEFLIKGDQSITESYSAIGPEVQEDATGRSIAHKSTGLVERLEQFDAMIIAGQAKSHCVAWTIEDLLGDIQRRDPGLARKVYLLDDCSSPVVVPGVVDYSEAAESAYRRFARSGMHVVNTSTPLADWPGIGEVTPDRT